MRNKGNFSLKIFLRNMRKSFSRCEVLENITLCRPLSDIFLFAHRSLWDPITPSTQAKSARTVTALSITFIIKHALKLYDRDACTSEAHIFVVI